MQITFSIINILIAVFSFLFLVFRFMDSYQTNNEKLNTKRRYENIWKLIENSRYKILPEILLSLILKLKSTKSETIEFIKKSKLFSSNYSFFIGLSVFLITQSNRIFSWNKKMQEHNYSYLILSIGILMFIYFYFFVIRFIDEYLNIKPKIKTSILNSLERDINFYPYIFLLSALLTINLLYFQEEYVFLSESQSFSKLGYVITINLIFDFLTFYMTIIIAGLFIKHKPKGWVVLCCISSLSIAFVFSFLTLVGINLACDLKLSLVEVMSNLTGNVYPENKPEITRWFLISHTTFLPILFYFSLIIFSYLGKLVILPISKVIWKSSIVEKPHYLTANLFAVISGLLIILKSIVEY